MQGSNHAVRARGAEVRWRVTTPSGVEFTCQVGAVAGGVEARLTSEDELVWSTVLSSSAAAGAVVHGWLRRVLAAGEADDARGVPLTVVH